MEAGGTPQETEESTVDVRKVGAFLALAFGLSWTSAVGLSLAGVELTTLRGLVLVTVLFMWAPAVAAIVVQRQYGESVRERCGLAMGRLRWIAIAWVAPTVLIGATIAVGALLPEVSLTTDYGAYFVEQGLTQERADEAVGQLEALPVPPAVLFVGQGLLAGLTVNALAALGEELGWRGLLLDELSPLGFWRLSGVTGVVWGVWHAPMILQGHNFPDAPVVGVLAMTAATVAMSPIYTYLTVRARSVLAATLFHGSFNGLGALSLVYLTGAGEVAISAVGVAGIGAAILVTVCCVVHDRFVADEPVTGGDPLSPWT